MDKKRNCPGPLLPGGLRTPDEWDSTHLTEHGRADSFMCIESHDAVTYELRTLRQGATPGTYEVHTCTSLTFDGPDRTVSEAALFAVLLDRLRFRAAEGCKLPEPCKCREAKAAVLALREAYNAYLRSLGAAELPKHNLTAVWDRQQRLRQLAGARAA